MDIFISWSGEKAEEIAGELRDWFPKAIQATNPWFSSYDIKSGGRWLNEITSKLEDINFGIICITPESVNSSWVAFEAGALSKTVDSSFVCPLVFGLDKTEVKGPLSQFQIRSFEKTDFFKLVQTVNKALGDNGLTESNLNEVYEIWWPNIELKINTILESNLTQNSQRKDIDILKEILDRVRGIETSFTFSENSTSNELKLGEQLREKMEKEIKLYQSQIDKINLLSTTDRLTGLPNRRYTIELATQYMKDKQNFSILMIDLNGFKEINDVYGHAVGDEVLVVIANRLTKLMKPKSIVSRLGGDEYLIVLDEFTENDLNIIVNKIRDTISLPMSLSGIKISITASIGVSVYPRDGESINALVGSADTAMYLAKMKKRNPYIETS